ncbi:hypothetical protein B0H34DRAFT_34338 [Crassisporium funariophilum]|nr:hypothetical protein B0H34DRAFT_34338 [Crassisporium funariophilum]
MDHHTNNIYSPSPQIPFPHAPAQFTIPSQGPERDDLSYSASLTLPSYPVFTNTTAAAYHEGDFIQHLTRVPEVTRRSPNRVPRPRNAFMIFRSDFSANRKINRSVEHDNRHISRIVGHCWNQMPEEEKECWRIKAEEEKASHLEKYPDYRFAPVTRVKKPLKRKVKRNGEDEMLRCRRVADLLLEGKEGDDLATAINEELPKKCSSHDKDESPETQPESTSCLLSAEPEALIDEPAFRSPLLPPSTPDNCPTANVPALENFGQSSARDSSGQRGSIPLLSLPARPDSDYQSTGRGDIRPYTPSSGSPTPSHSPTYAHTPAHPRYNVYHPSPQDYSPTYSPYQSPYGNPLSNLPEPVKPSYNRELQLGSSSSTDDDQGIPMLPGPLPTQPRSHRIMFINPFGPNTTYPGYSQYNEPLSPVGPLEFHFQPTHRTRY